MNRYTIILLLLLGLFSTVAHAQSGNTIKVAYGSKEVDKLNIDNLYGHVRINRSKSDSIKITVNIEGYGVNSEGNKRNKDVQVKFNLSSGVLKATTVWNKAETQHVYRINYDVELPASKKLSVKNLYGDVYVQELANSSSFDLLYGDLIVDEFTGDEMEIKIEYGDVKVPEVNKLSGEITYGDLKIDKINTLDIVSLYSDIMVGKIQKARIDSRYDNLRVESIGSLDIHERHSDVVIGYVSKSAIFDSAYGDIYIRGVMDSFKLLDIYAEYSDFYVMLGDIQYGLNLKSSYADIEVSTTKYPFNGTQSRTSFDINMNGFVGKSSADIQVNVVAKYGEISLRN